MEKKMVTLIVLLITSIIVFMLISRKEGVLENAMFRGKAPVYTKGIEKIHYTIKILNYTISGETECITGSKISDLLRYNLQVDLSRKLGKKILFVFDPIDKKLICFNNFCGNWEIKLNNKTVFLNDTCREGNLELRFLG